MLVQVNCVVIAGLLGWIDQDAIDVWIDLHVDAEEANNRMRRQRQVSHLRVSAIG